MARTLSRENKALSNGSDGVKLVQEFLRSEISPQFELVQMLDHGVAVHHSGLSDETRALVEWLAEEGSLRCICSTTTVAQGINLPISAVFLASTKYPYGKEMPARDFWNLAGRAGRVFQDSIGVVGISSRHGDVKQQDDIRRFVKGQTEKLVSTLTRLVKDAFATANALNLNVVIHKAEWQAFWGYLAHVYNQTKSAEKMTAEAEHVLRSTFGYRTLEKDSQQMAKSLLQLTKDFAQELSGESHLATLADATGFAPDSLRSAIGQLSGKVKASDWQPKSLFGKDRESLRSLMGIMLHLPETRSQLEDVAGWGFDHGRLADVTADWVGGKTLEELAREYFSGPTATKTCRAIYGRLALGATWGLAALSKLPTSGLNFESLSEEAKRAINCLPAMIYYGVGTQEGILMRMHNVPRSIAEPLGSMFREDDKTSVDPAKAGEFLKALTISDWDKAVPPNSIANGTVYRDVWHILSGARERQSS
jgi:replicative superfamily II helicase